MECKDIREKLGAYLEEVVPPEERRIIEDHLNSCPKCAKNLADLKKAGELVKNLAEVEPPAWLTQKIMSRVRKESEKRKGIWPKLFYPLHIKVPIQALATVFIAVIAVYVFRVVEPERKLGHLPAPIQPVLPKEETAKALPAITPDSPTGRQKTALKDQAEREFAEVPAVPPGTPLPSPVEKPLPAEKRQEAQEMLGKGEGIALSRSAEETRERKKIAAAPGVKGLAALKAKHANILLRVSDVQVAGGKVEDLFRQLGAAKIEKESQEEKEVLTAEINPMKWKDLLEKLKVVGEVHEWDLPQETPAGDAVIRIEIVRSP